MENGDENASLKIIHKGLKSYRGILYERGESLFSFSKNKSKVAIYIYNIKTHGFLSGTYYLFSMFFLPSNISLIY